MPPPPAQTTTEPRSSNQEIGSISMICCGSGEGTTRRQAAPSCRNAQALSLRERLGVRLGVGGADELRRVGERRVVRIDRDHGEDRHDRPVGRQRAPQLLLDEVADHALGSRVQDVQGVRLGAAVGLGLQGQQAHLRSVAVHDDEVVLRGQRCHRLGRGPDVAPLYRRGHRVRTPQQCIPAQCEHDPHSSLQLGERPSSAERRYGRGSAHLAALCSVDRYAEQQRYGGQEERGPVQPEGLAGVARVPDEQDGEHQREDGDGHVPDEATGFHRWRSARHHLSWASAEKPYGMAAVIPVMSTSVVKTSAPPAPGS